MLVMHKYVMYKNLYKDYNNSTNEGEGNVDILKFLHSIEIK